MYITDQVSQSFELLLKSIFASKAVLLSRELLQYMQNWFTKNFLDILMEQKKLSFNDSMHFFSDVGFSSQMWRRHHQYFSSSWKEFGSYKNSFHLPSSLMKDFFLQFMITCIHARYSVLIGQSAMGYCASRPMEKLCVLWIII